MKAIVTIVAGLTLGYGIPMLALRVVFLFWTRRRRSSDGWILDEINRRWLDPRRYEQAPLAGTRYDRLRSSSSTQ